MSGRGSPALFLGALGAGALVLLAVAGGGSPTDGARAVGGFMKRRLGQFFTLAEMMRSSLAEQLGLDDAPTPAAQANLEQLVAVALGPVRLRPGREVHVRSGYRSCAVNRAVKGSPTSQHMAGEAVDIKVDGLAAEDLATVIVELGVPFDQVIGYDPERGGHVSFTTTRVNHGWQ